MVKALFIIIIQLSVLLSAMSQNIQFKHLSVTNGLLSNNVGNICQDSRGYIWFGTGEGLNKYNGYTMTAYTHNQDDSLTICSNRIQDIIEDTIPGNLWLATNDGLSYYNSASDNFLNYYFKEAFREVNSEGIIRSLTWSEDQELWFTTNRGIFHFKYPNTPILLANADDSNRFGYINTIEYWKDSLYLISASEGLFVFNALDYSHKRLIEGYFWNGLKDRNNNFWFGTRTNGLWFMPNSSEASFEHYSLENGKLKGNFVSALAEDSVGNIWVSIRSEGIQIIKPNNAGNEYLLSSLDQPNGLRSSGNGNIYVDREKNIWIGSDDAGVCFLDHQQKRFDGKHYNYVESGFTTNSIRSMYQDSDGKIWIGSKRGGCLSLLDKERGTVKHFRPDKNKPNSLSDDFILSITEHDEDHLWVGTLQAGLDLFDKNSGKCINYQPVLGDSNSLSGLAVYALLKDSKKRLWVGTGWDGVDVFDKNMNKILSLDSSFTSTLTDRYIRSIFEDSNHNIWIGTQNGLCLYNEQANNFSSFKADALDSKSISNNRITSIYEDRKNRLWIGTSVGGLNLMDRQNGTFVSYSQSDGLASNVIFGIVEDELGNLWLSTKTGFSKFVLADKGAGIPTADFRNYDAIDGLSGKEYSLNAFLKTTEGLIAYGGSKGINFFDPEIIMDNTTIPEIHFTSLKLFNEPVEIGAEGSPLKTHINQTKRLDLTYKQTIFTINYVAIDYSSSEKMQYAYKLQGLENEWVYVNNRRDATYNSLRPGSYTFMVKAANSDGLWNEEAKTIAIKILPPPWLTWWAYSLYVMALLMLILLFKRLSVQKVKEEKERELDQNKLKFFINISHELRTPLSLILSPLDRIRSTKEPEEVQSAVSTISRSTHQLLRLVNQLLDYRKVELGKLSLNASNVDILEFTRELYRTFKETASSKNIKMFFNSTESSINAWVDPNMYEKIINNLLSNAIKFSEDSDEITVSLSLVDLNNNTSLFGVLKRVQEPKQFVEIKVSDTGIGIDDKYIKKIFDRFQSINENGTGTGIGLNYAKGLVDLHKGKIKVESEIGLGSTFTVYLPLGKAHLKSDQISESKFILNNFTFNVSDIESVGYELNTADSTLDEAQDEDDGLQPESTHKQKTVLIVEDNRELRLQLKRELESQYIVKQAINGLDGCEKANKFFPDIIISDVMMPKMDGIEFCGEIKSNIDTSHIPVILLTAKGLVVNQIEGLKIGADDYIVKPFDMSVLIARINNILESRKKLREKYLASSTLLPSSELTQNNKDELFVDTATKIVLDNITDPDFNYKEILTKMGVSRSSFYRKITELTGMSPSLFVRHIRIKYAAELLLKNEMSIKEICFKSGFNSSSYFNRTFRVVFKKSPQEYLDEHIGK